VRLIAQSPWKQSVTQHHGTVADVFNGQLGAVVGVVEAQLLDDERRRYLFCIRRMRFGT
jgi:hypothetical protein